MKCEVTITAEEATQIIRDHLAKCGMTVTGKVETFTVEDHGQCDRGPPTHRFGGFKATVETRAGVYRSNGGAEFPG